MSTEADALRRNIRIALMLVGAISLGVVAAKIAGTDIPLVVLIFAIVLISIIVPVFAWGYWYRHTHTPEERAAWIAEFRSKQDGIKFARGTTKYKREVLRTGAAGRAVISAVVDLRYGDESSQLVCLELEVTVGADAPYAVTTGEYLGAGSAGSVAVGRQLVVRVDLADRQRVAVDWDQSLRQPPTAPTPPVVMPPQQSVAQRLQELETLRATGAISDAEYLAKRERIIAEI